MFIFANCFRVNFHIFCVFWPAFMCCAHLKASWNTFWGCFQPFLLVLAIFHWFSSENKKETSKNSVLGYSLKLVDSLKGVPQFCRFGFIFSYFGLFLSIFEYHWVATTFLVTQNMFTIKYYSHYVMSRSAENPTK